MTKKKSSKKQIKKTAPKKTIEKNSKKLAGKKSKTNKKKTKVKAKDNKKTAKPIKEKKVKKSSHKKNQLKKTKAKSTIANKKPNLDTKKTQPKSTTADKKPNLEAKKTKAKSTVADKKPNLEANKLNSNLKQKENELKKIIEKEKEEKMILKDLQGRTYCQIENCDYSAVAEGYCRIHFFGLYKIIKKKNEILEQDILKKRFSNLVNNHSKDIFEPLLKDLSSDKNFKMAIKKISTEETEEIEN